MKPPLTNASDFGLQQFLAARACREGTAVSKTIATDAAETAMDCAAVKDSSDHFRQPADG